MSKVGLKDLVLIGQVVRPHGLTGLLRIVSYAESKETFLRAGSVFLDKGEDELFERRVVSIMAHRSVYLLKLSGLRSVDEAESFRGAGILIRKDSVVRSGEDEFFWYELIGLDVYLITGQYVGVLKGIFPTGSNDVYVVENEGREFLIPAIHQVVKEINIAQKRMVISPMRGLLDL
ncbi:MAG: 16S rRNA processing protein RimM [Desulfobacterales bacterium]|nr:16S rRNA processing protein RimM [Desulfobacterales bacterium]